MSKQEICFREATGQDVGGVIDFFNQVGTETEFLIMDETGFAGKKEALAQVLEQTFNDPGQICLLAMFGEVPIGMLSIKTDYHERVSHIGDVFIAVKKAYWGHGIGQILMEEAINWAECSGIIRRLELTV